MGMTMEAQEARREYMREYRQRNRDRINSQRKNWNAQNPEKVRECQRRYWEGREVKRNIRASWKEYELGDEADRKKLYAICQSGKYESIVRKTAYQTCPDIAEYLIKSVTQNKSYDRLEFDGKLGRICVCKSDFYGYRRRFYHYLDVALKYLQMEEGEDMQ